MTLIEASLAALYPVVIALGLMTIMRFMPIVKSLPEPGTRWLVVGLIIITVTIVAEQILYGYARLRPALYVQITQWAPLVGALKIGYVVGLLYKLAAFWKISPKQPGLWAPTVAAFSIWLTSVLLLVF